MDKIVDSYNTVKSSLDFQKSLMNQIYDKNY